MQILVGSPSLVDKQLLKLSQFIRVGRRAASDKNDIQELADLADKIWNITPNSHLNSASLVQEDAITKITESMDKLDKEFRMMKIR